MKNQTVQLVTPGQMKDIISAVIQAIPTDMSFDTAQHWVEKKSKLGDEIRKIFVKFNPLVEWQTFYRDIGVEADFSGLRIPERPQGFDRLIIVAQGMMPQWLYDKCKELFPCWKWTEESLDKVIDFSFQTRSAKNGAYAIWIRDRIEADEELKNLSANDLKREKITGITLEERLVYELKYFKEMGKHLDIKNVTLCSGSRCIDGGVPFVRFFQYTGRMYVGWADLCRHRDFLRSRQVVSA